VVSKSAVNGHSVATLEAFDHHIEILAHRLSYASTLSQLPHCRASPSSLGGQFLIDRSNSTYYTCRAWQWQKGTASEADFDVGGHAKTCRRAPRILSTCD
jgi:hypothetical protein